jgi:hypothetical protein
MPINIDSIHVVSLSHVVDSLSQQVHDSRISEGYFTALLSIQTGIFLFVIGVMAFIAWKSIISRITQRHNQILAKNSTFQKGINDKLDMFNGELSSQLVEINKASDSNQELLYRSMYIMTDNKQSYLACFLWAVRTSHIIMTKNMFNDEDKLKSDLYIDAVENSLNNLISNNVIITAEFFKEMVSNLEVCIAYKAGKYKDKFQKVLDEMNKYYYINLPISTSSIAPPAPTS